MMPIDVLVNSSVKGSNIMAGSVELKCKSTKKSTVDSNQKHRMPNCASCAMANSRKTWEVSTVPMDQFY
jgi:hypothetical protein